MTIFSYVLMSIVILIIVLAIIAPKDYEVSRTILISRPFREVFKYLKSLKKQDNWSSWAEKDPNMKNSFTGVDGEVGSISF